MRRLLAQRDFRLLSAGLGLSMFGDWCLVLVLGIWVKELTDSNAAAGLALLFFAAGHLLAPVAGWVVDRVRRRPFLVGLLLASIGALAPLLAVHDRGDVWIIDAVALLLGFSGVLTNAGLSALLKTMLADDDLGEANAVLRTIKEGLRLVGPLTGASLYATFGATTVIAVDGATFVVAAVALLALHIDEPRPAHSAATEHWLREATAGFRQIRLDARMRHTVVAVAMAAVVIGIIEPVMFAVVDTGLGRSPSFLGVLEMVQGVGAVAGGLVAARTIRRLGEERTVAVGLLVLAVSFLALAPPSLPVVLSGIVTLGIALPLIVVAFYTLIQRRSPVDRVGRVAAAAELAFGVPQVLSIAAGAALISTVSYRILLTVMALGVAAAAVYLVLRSRSGAVAAEQGDLVLANLRS